MLHAAALRGVVSVVQLLLEAGADPASQDCAGETALSLAVLLGQWECAEAMMLSPGGAGAVQVAA
jgi:ankyrin repeat protein